MQPRNFIIVEMKRYYGMKILTTWRILNPILFHAGDISLFYCIFFWPKIVRTCGCEGMCSGKVCVQLR